MSLGEFANEVMRTPSWRGLSRYLTSFQNGFVINPRDISLDSIISSKVILAIVLLFAFRSFFNDLLNRIKIKISETENT